MNQLFILLPAFIFGTIVGSFLNVVIWRLPRQESLGGRSQCPHCGHTLAAKNLIPLVSYLVQGRSCAYCSKPIASRYIIIEIITGLLFAFAAGQFLSYHVNTLTLLGLGRVLLIVAVLIVVFVIDLEHYLILDAVVFPASAAIIIINFFLDLVNHSLALHFYSYTFSGLAAAVLSSGFFYAIWRLSRGRWMGFGDVKFSLFLGLALGLVSTGVALFLSFMLGSAVGLVLIAFGWKQLSSRVPFGTFLSAGALLALFYGPDLALWYSHLIGWQ